MCRGHEPPTVWKLIERYAGPFWARYGDSIPLDQHRALKAILECRTESMGGHRYACDCCGHQHYAWHSCHHRLCPRCGAADTAEWVDKQLGKLLPVPYFLVTFTLPGKLRGYAKTHPDFIEGFFQDASQALQTLLADPSRCGFAKNGFMGVYQSWDQQMRYHPHIHFIVPGIGLDKHGQLKRLSNPKYLINERALASCLKPLLTQRLEGKIKLAQLIAVRKQRWIVDVAPAGNGKNAVKYLGQYVGRSVIGDGRILKIQGDTITIRTLNRDTKKYEPHDIDGVEFVRRYLLHALPSGFHRIRYRGFLHARAKHTLQILQTLLGAHLVARNKEPPPTPPPILCPRCGSAMQRGLHRGRDPPYIRNLRFRERIAA